MDGYESERIHRSIAWNQIAHRLQQDSFWNFLTNNAIYDTRIDFLLKLYVNNDPVNSNIDKYSTFYTIYEKHQIVENKVEFVNQFWNSIQLLFEELNNW